MVESWIKRGSLGMSKTGCQAVVLIVTIAALCVVPAGLASPAPHELTLPQDLVSLEQKMQELDVNSERVALRLSFPGFAEAGKAHSIHAVGEMSVKPREARFDFTEPDGSKTEERQIGENLYVRVRGLGKLAKGRRWELQSASELRQPGLSFGTPGEPRQQGMFMTLIEALEGASSVREVGPATVDGVATTEFVAKLDVKRVLRSPSSTEGTKQSVLRAFEKLGLELKVFIEPDGLPVRTKLILGVKRRFETAQADILSVGVPVEVLAPPAAEVISEAELRKRLEADAKRRCPRLQPVGCRLRLQPPS